MSDTAIIPTLDPAPLEAELLQIARELGPDELELLIRVAADLLRRHRQHGELQVATDPRALRPESVAAFASRMVAEAEVHLSRVRMAAALLCAVAREER